MGRKWKGNVEKMIATETHTWAKIGESEQTRREIK